MFFWDKRGVDDPVGAISVHGVNGLWGVISVGIFANGKYGAGWNGVVRDELVKKYGSDGVRGILYGDAIQLSVQLIDCGGGRRLRLRDGLRLVQDQQPDHADSRSARRSSSRVSTVPRWARSATPILHWQVVEQRLRRQPPRNDRRRAGALTRAKHSDRAALTGQPQHGPVRHLKRARYQPAGAE